MLTSAAMAERKSWVSKFANSIKNIGQSSDQSNTLKVEAISQLNNAANAKAALVTKAFHLCQMFLGEAPKPKWHSIVYETCQQGGWADKNGAIYGKPH